MTLVTVTGATNHTYSVTVSGTSDQTLQNQYKSATGGGSTVPGGGPTVGGGSTVMGGSNAVSVSSSSVFSPVYAVLSAAPTVAGSQIPAHINGPAGGKAFGLHMLGAPATISAAGEPSLQAGDSNRISVDGTMNFIGGRPGVDHGPEDIIFAETGQMSLYGASSGHYVLMGKDAQGDSFFEERDPEGNIHVDADQVPARHDVLMDRHETVHGASAISQPYFDSTLRGGMGNGPSGFADADNVTVHGGSGGAGIFEFTSNQASSYIIEDFGRAAGNKVALSGVSRNELNNMIEHKTVSNGSTSLTLPDKTEVTFLNDDNITDSDFII